MPINEGFVPARPLPLVPDDAIEQEETGNARDGVVASARVLKMGALIAAVTATAIAVAVPLTRDAAPLKADVTASLGGNSSLKPETDQSPPTIQSTVDAATLVQPAAEPQVSPPTTTHVSAREEVAAAEPAGKDPAATSIPASENLFRQFQSWAAEQDAKPNYRPLVQEDPAQVVKRDAGSAPRLTQKRRYVRPVQNARAEVRTENVRKKLRRTPHARAARPPVEEARPQGQSVQDAQASFPSAFGLRN